MKILIKFCFCFCLFNLILHANYKTVDGKVFFRDRLVRRRMDENVLADSKTFEIINEKYGKDKDKVYYGDYEIYGADPKTFKVVSNGFSTDKNNVYRYWKKLSHVDIESFKIFNGQKDYIGVYFKDKNGVYFSLGEILFEKIDIKIPKSFEILADGYAKDKNNIYFYGEKIENVDIKTFEVLEVDKYGNRNYARDKNNIYYKGNKING